MKWVIRIILIVIALYILNSTSTNNIRNIYEPVTPGSPEIFIVSATNINKIDKEK